MSEEKEDPDEKMGYNPCITPSYISSYETRMLKRKLLSSMRKDCLLFVSEGLSRIDSMDDFQIKIFNCFREIIINEDYSYDDYKRTIKPIIDNFYSEWNINTKKRGK